MRDLCANKREIKYKKEERQKISHNRELIRLVEKKKERKKRKEEEEKIREEKKKSQKGMEF